MSETISKSLGESLAGKGELYAALAYDATDRFGGMRIKGIYIAPPSATVPAIEIGQTLSSTTGQNMTKIGVTDSAALASGYSRAIYIDWAKTGAQTGGYVNPFSIDFAATVAACTEVALESHYITQTGNKLTGNVFVWQAYLEDVGTAAQSVCPIEIGRVCTNTGASRDAFARFKTHGGTAKCVFFVEGTSNAMATNLFTFCGTDTSPFQRGTALSGSIIGRITINHEATPGGTSTTYYIPVYTS